MGHRVLIQLESDGYRSPHIYLHNGGYKEWLQPALAECERLMKSRGADLSYATARLVGIFHERIEGNLSLGIHSSDHELTAADSHGDSGCLIINIDRFWSVTQMGSYEKEWTENERVTPEIITE